MQHEISEPDQGPYMALFTICSLVLSEILPVVLTFGASILSTFSHLFLNIYLHIMIPPVFMDATQLVVWWIGGIAGIFTIMNFIGYTPKWLFKLKDKFKNGK
ncbi:MAG TPA: hypothetical protein VN922_00925 [Bacteroidia bacterium]|nr:hypothetical protein [Bacteroidia bacterium]